MSSVQQCLACRRAAPARFGKCPYCGEPYPAAPPPWWQRRIALPRVPVRRWLTLKQPSGRTIAAMSAVALLFVLTNPRKTEYVEWLKQEVVNRWMSRGEGDQVAENMAALALADTYYAARTTVQNYDLCAVYRTEFDNAHVTAIGALRNFWMLDVQRKPGPSGVRHQ